MNKIIIIGNGFDLAHGLKTSYNHFLESYFKKVCLGSITPHRYEDDLLQSRSTYYPTAFSLKRNDPIDFLSYYYDKPEAFMIKSDFLKSLIDENKKYNWVDIENAFFHKLFGYINIPNKRANIDKIKILNRELDYIKKSLIDYLKEETAEFNFEPDPRYIASFIRGIRRNPADFITFINFNYTTIVSAYINRCIDALKSSFKSDQIKNKIQLINIHGSIDSEDENPIFGIGDEHHEMYKAVKEFDDIQTILKNSKSFWYQRNTNYTKIVDILNRSNQYKVEIYGHSCGLSDRTLLKNIFEHESVKNIEIFHYGGIDGYVKQSYDVWRHFDDSHIYRSKLVAYNENNEMPQLVEVN